MEFSHNLLEQRLGLRHLLIRFVQTIRQLILGFQLAFVQILQTKQKQQFQQVKFHKLLNKEDKEQGSLLQTIAINSTL